MTKLDRSSLEKISRELKRCKALKNHTNKQQYYLPNHQH